MFHLYNTNTPHKSPWREIILHLLHHPTIQLIAKPNSYAMTTNTQINLACGHSTKIWRQTTLHRWLNKPSSQLSMDWEDKICQACKEREFQEGMVRVVQWLAGVESYEATNAGVGSNSFVGPIGEPGV